MKGKITIIGGSVNQCGTVFDVSEGTELSVTDMHASNIGTYLITRPQGEPVKVNLLEVGLKPETPRQIFDDALSNLEKHKHEPIAKRVEVLEGSSLKDYLANGTTALQFLTALIKLYQSS
ncbi:hypothetical protein [Serratia sp. CY80841]|uniref:hypothetical protein n=1 Tax=Serratia sp. CY80841 TaxID=3383682 RepID=UPI003FA1779D